MKRYIVISMLVVALIFETGALVQSKSQQARADARRIAAVTLTRDALRGWANEVEINNLLVSASTQVVTALNQCVESAPVTVQDDSL